MFLIGLCNQIGQVLKKHQLRTSYEQKICLALLAFGLNYQFLDVPEQSH
jgi:hypothetical protein